MGTLYPDRPKAPIFKHPGSKWTLAPHYPAPNPKYTWLIEPCAGAAAYTLRYADPKQHQVWLNDADPGPYGVANLWQWLLSVEEDEIRRLPTQLPEGEDLRNFMSPGAANFVRRWQRVGNSTCWTVSKWNGKPGMWRPRVIETTIATLRWIHSFRYPWRITQLECTHVVGKEGVWFVDPVYQSKHGWYRASHANYQALGEWCRSRRGQVIVCELEGADWLPFRPLVEVHSGAAHYGGKRVTEMIWRKP